MDLSKILNYFHLGRRKFNENLANLMSFFYVRIYLIANIGLNLLNWIFVYIVNTKVSQDLVVLHYNVDFGVNLIGSVKKLYIIPALGLIIIIINFTLLSVTYKQNKFFSNLLLAGAFLANLFLFLAISSIYLVNFYR